VFRYLLVLPEGSPTEPSAVLVTAVPNWKVGETCMTGSGDQFRILAKSSDVAEELHEQGSTAWTVEPLE
jgi:hypothetical protein